MLRFVLVILLVTHSSANTIVHSEDLDYDSDDFIQLTEETDERRNLNAFQMRCTRRFSPGTCLDEVRPVWTYNFHLQNCTERMGCRHTTTTNRFLSYSRCMENCQSLIQIYNHILSQGTMNESDKWPQDDSLRRIGSEDQPISEEDKEEESSSLEESRYVPILPESRENVEEIELAEILPADIDYQAPEFEDFEPK